MLQLSLNEIPKELYPQPMLKPNFQIHELQKIRKEMKSEEKVEKNRIRSITEQLLRSIKVFSPKQKPKHFKAVDSILKKPSNTTPAEPPPHNSEKLLKEYLDQDRVFQHKAV